MAKCGWREKPGSDESCSLLAVYGKEMCPRHEMLQELVYQKDHAKRQAAILKRKVVSTGAKTRRELIEQGFQFKGSGACAACEAHIEWWRTPNQHNAPYNPMPEPDSHAVSHFVTCPRANTFRKQAA